MNASVKKNSENKLVIGITGITGTLGQRLTYLLNQNGIEVIGLVRPESFDKMNDEPSFRVIKGDVNNYSSVINLVKESDIIIHLAAHVGHGSLQQYRKINVDGTENICRAIIEHKPQCRLINCSSIAALRIPKLLPVAATVYARTKYEADQIIKKYTVNFKLQATTIYPGLIYGPGDTKFLPTVINTLKKGRLFYVSGGESHAPLIYIDDLCKLFYLAATNQKSIGQHYIGVGHNDVGIHSFFNTIASRIGVCPPKMTIAKSLMLPLAIVIEKVYQTIRTKQSPPLTRRVVDILSINFSRNTASVNETIGWQPETSTYQGLNNFFYWFNKHNSSKDNE